MEVLNNRLTAAIIKAAKRNINFGRGNRKRAPFWDETCEETGQCSVSTCDSLLEQATAPNHTGQDIDCYLVQREMTANTIQTETEEHAWQKIMEATNDDGDLWRVLDDLAGRRPAARPAATAVADPGFG